MHRGYIKIWRKVEDSGLLQMHSTFALFMHMLIQATHKPIRVGTAIGMVDLDRGQLISGRHKLAAIIGLTEQKARTCLEHLHAMDMITSRPTSKFTVYTIVNYENYQCGDAEDNQQANQQITNKQPTDNQQITTIQTHKHINTINKPLCASSDDDCADDEKTNSIYTKQFLTFWDLYPKKKSKGGAAKAFAKIKAVEYAAIRAGLDAAVASSEWKKNGGEFIPHPATWLNARGWEDEQPTSSTKPFDMDEFLRNA